LRVACLKPKKPNFAGSTLFVAFNAPPGRWIRILSRKGVMAVTATDTWPAPDTASQRPAGFRPELRDGARSVKSTPAKSITVLCVTPCGRFGRGGIDRLYYHLRSSPEVKLPDHIQIHYFVGRGSARAAGWVLTFPWRIVRFACCLMWLRPDIVHLNFSNDGSIYRKYFFLLVANLFKIPSVIHFHGQFTAADIARARLPMRFLRSMCARATRVIALGKCYWSSFAADFGVSTEKLDILANGIADFAVNVPLPKQGDERVRLLFIGEIGHRKGIDILVDALAQLAPRTRAWSCLIAGNGDSALFQQRVSQASCADLVDFVAWLEPKEVERALLHADIVILPSRADTMPMSLIEGACAGAALVATKVGEIEEIVQDGRNGVLVPPSGAALSAALERLISQRKELARMQFESRKVYNEKFKIETFVEGLSAVYGRALTTQA
jgi:glycosyltransferase involved in cell wall biosynthesis